MDYTVYEILQAKILKWVWHSNKWINVNNTQKVNWTVKKYCKLKTYQFYLWAHLLSFSYYVLVYDEESIVGKPQATESSLKTERF